jgi:hypothetical protein
MFLFKLSACMETLKTCTLSQPLMYNYFSEYLSSAKILATVQHSCMFERTKHLFVRVFHSRFLIGKDKKNINK